MIDFEIWDKFVDDFDTYKHKKNARVTDIDGEIYEGVCKGYVEDDDSNGNSVWAIRLGARKFTQEMVEKIEFLD